MKSKTHKYINGKVIHIGDVVVIHKAEKYFGPLKLTTKHSNQLYYSEIGIVTRFGCVLIECKDWFLPNPNFYKRTINLYFDPSEIEVIGKL